MVQHAPTGDAVAEFEFDVAGVGRVAELHFGFEVTGVGAQEGDRAGVGVEKFDEKLEHFA